MQSTLSHISNRFAVACRQVPPAPSPPLPPSAWMIYRQQYTLAILSREVHTVIPHHTHLPYLLQLWLLLELASLVPPYYLSREVYTVIPHHTHLPYLLQLWLLLESASV